MGGMGTRRGIGGAKTPEGQARARANLVQYRKPGAKRPRHGAYSVDGTTQEVVTRRSEIENLIAADMGGEVPKRSVIVAQVLAIVLTQIERLAKHLTDQGPITKGGEVRPALETLTRLSKSALDLANSLGLTPAARARMGIKDSKSDPYKAELARLLAESEKDDEVK